MAVSFKVEDAFQEEEIIQALNEIAQPVEIAVWNTSNYFNFGGLIRTCHNFAVRKMWGIDLWKDPESPLTKPYYKRAAMTAHKWMKQNIHCVTSEEFLSKVEGRNIVAFERREGIDSEDIRSFEYPDNPILLFGSEKDGIPDHLMVAAQSVVSIPVMGFCLDFNLAQAASIAIYDWTLKNTNPNFGKSND